MDLITILNNPTFLKVMSQFSVISFFLAMAFAVAGMMQYGRGRDPEAADEWTVLFATWRDSLTITILFTSQGLLYRFSEFSAFDLTPSGPVYFYGPVVVPILLFVSDVLIFVVAFMRVLALGRWISARRSVRETSSNR